MANRRMNAWMYFCIRYEIGFGLLLLALAIYLGRKVFVRYANSGRNFEDWGEAFKINMIIFGASLIMFLLILLGEFVIIKHLKNKPPDPLWPTADNEIGNHYLLFGAGIIFYFLCASFPLYAKWPNPYCAALRCGSNCLLFLLAGIGAFCWVAHSGGLTGMYGAAYLSLFSIALVVPKSKTIKWIIAIPVGMGAFSLALISKNPGVELYLCSMSIVGGFIGYYLQDFVRRVELKSAKG